MIDVVGGQKEQKNETFGQYQIIAKVGAGGMATVHRARHLGIAGFERIVALKRLLPSMAKSEDFVKMFIREATLASKLQHPNIVQVYDLGEVEGTYFISMEFIDGWSLAQIIRQAQLATQGPLPINVSLSLLIQACDALEYAHHATDAAGKPLDLIHRDISPANLLVTRSGHLKVIDFGIARAGIDDPKDGDVIKGKFGYLAPELLSGGNASIGTDIFALGVVAHELLTGRRLFSTESDLSTIENILYNDPEPPSAINIDCPPEFDQTVLLALNRDPHHRQQTCGEFREQLLQLRRQYHLNASSLEVASWLSHAFKKERKRRVDTNESYLWANDLKQRRFPQGTGTTLACAQLPEEALGDNNQRTGSEAGLHRPFGYYADVEITASEVIRSQERAKERPNDSRSRSSVDLDDHPSLSDMELALPTRVLRGVDKPTVGLAAPTGPFASAQMRMKPTNLTARLLLWFAIAGVALLAVITYKWLRSETGNREGLASRTTGLKVAIDPSDAIVKIAGQQPQASGIIELEPGIYSIAIERAGYQTWNSTIDLASGELKNVSVSMRQLAAVAQPPRVNIVASKSGLHIALDGEMIAHKTPWAFDVTPGTHTIALFSMESGGNKEELWSTTIDAQLDQRYEFSPSIRETRNERETREREAQERANTPDAKVATKTKSASPHRVARTVESPPTKTQTDLAPTSLSLSSNGLATGGLMAIVPPPKQQQQQKNQLDKRANNKPRVIVQRNVKRISGSFPSVRRALIDRVSGSRSGALLLCISKSGHVTSAKPLNKKLPGEINATFVKAAKRWRYKPYKEGGVPVPACFSVVFRLRSSR